MMGTNTKTRGQSRLILRIVAKLDNCKFTVAKGYAGDLFCISEAISKATVVELVQT